MKRLNQIMVLLFCLMIGCKGLNCLEIYGEEQCQQILNCTWHHGECQGMFIPDERPHSIYIDPVNGLDSNHGSPIDPLQTLLAGLQKLVGLDGILWIWNQHGNERLILFSNITIISNVEIR